ALRLEARLATALAGVAAAVLSASAWWWQLMVERAPSFFGGVAPGRSASALTPQVVATLAVMALALVTCAYGVWRISSAGRDPARG
ncbi:MAG: hypothetical protein ACRDV0_10490, partial [Acidimicrobiales bacterium]